MRNGTVQKNHQTSTVHLCDMFDTQQITIVRSEAMMNQRPLSLRTFVLAAHFPPTDGFWQAGRQGVFQRAHLLLDTTASPNTAPLILCHGASQYLRCVILPSLSAFSHMYHSELQSWSVHFSTSLRVNLMVHTVTGPVVPGTASLACQAPCSLWKSQGRSLGVAGQQSRTLEIPEDPVSGSVAACAGTRRVDWWVKLP